MMTPPAIPEISRQKKNQKNGIDSLKQSKNESDTAIIIIRRSMIVGIR